MSEFDEFASTYYLRDRGRVEGPYDLEAARGLVQRGRLGRHSEVSIDGKSWLRAAEITELFDAKVERKVRQQVRSVSRKATQEEATTSGVTSSGKPEPRQTEETKATRDWYYHQFGEKQGPVPEEELRALLKRGQVAEDAYVWAEGMEEWQPILATPLRTALPNTGQPSSAAPVKQSRRRNDKAMQLAFGILDIAWGVSALAFGGFCLVWLLVKMEGDSSGGGVVALVITWAVLLMLNGGFFIACGLLLLGNASSGRVFNCIAAGVALLIGLLELIMVFVLLAQVPPLFRSGGLIAFVVIGMLAALIRTISYPVALLVWVNSRAKPRIADA